MNPDIRPLPQYAGAPLLLIIIAFLMMQPLSMAVAFIAGTVVGATHNGTLYPLAIIVCALGALVFSSARMIAAAQAKAA